MKAIFIIKAYRNPKLALSCCSTCSKHPPGQIACTRNNNESIMARCTDSRPRDSLLLQEIVRHQSGTDVTQLQVKIEDDKLYVTKKKKRPQWNVHHAMFFSWHINQGRTSMELIAILKKK